MARFNMGSKSSRARLAACLLAAGLLAACDGASGPYPGLASPGAPAAVPTAAAAQMDARFQDLGGSEPTNGSSYQIGPADVLGISVFQVPELNIDAQVSSDGTVVLPLVGSLKVGGKQPQDVEHDIAARLRAKYLQSPQVTVFVKGFNSQKIVVSGAVVSPGTLAMSGDMTLTSALADAKGLSDIADPHSIAVFRRVNGAKYAARFDLDDVTSGKVADIHLAKGDVVVVDTSDWKYGLKTLLPVASQGASTGSMFAHL